MRTHKQIDKSGYLGAREVAQLLSQIEALKSAGNGSMAGVGTLIGIPHATLYWIHKHRVTARAAARIQGAIDRYKAKIGVDSLTPSDPPAARNADRQTFTMTVAASDMQPRGVRLRNMDKFASNGEADVRAKARELVATWGMDALRLVLRLADDA